MIISKSVKIFNQFAYFINNVKIIFNYLFKYFIMLLKRNKAETFLILVFLFSLTHVYFSCTPSQKFLLKQNIVSGVDKEFIRVLLKKTDKRVLISAKSKLKITVKKTDKVIYNDQGKDIYFQPEQIDNPLEIESGENYILIDGLAYRGIVELHNIFGKIYVINVLQMNEYLYSVVPSEIISTWETEALKAQAVAARTYAYHHLINTKKSIYDLDDSSNFQVYKGISAEKDSTTIAVNETSGKIMLHKGKAIAAFFHSTCGGRTSHDKYVWNSEGQNYLKSVACRFCQESPYFSWEEKISLYEIKEFLGRKYNAVGNITGISFQKKDDRVVTAVINHRNGIIKLTGNELRLLFPEKRIKSMYFSAEKIKDGLVLHGHGWGHGVGMCQWGAKGLASKGADYKDILKYYYSGISISSAGQRNYAGR